MDKQQENILNVADFLRTEPPPKYLVFVPGFHFCPDFDGLALCDVCPEVLEGNCTCGGGDD